MKNERFYLPNLSELARYGSGGEPLSEAFARELLAPLGREISLEELAALAKTCFASPGGAVAQLVKDRAALLRQKLYGNSVVVMAPVEISNACASDCQFCGWRVSNSAMRRMRVPDDLALMQVEYLIRLGITYIEFVSGDDMVAVREVLPRLIRQTRRIFEREGIEGKISFCSLALTENQYRELREAGADSMILWQETYDPQVFRRHVLGGPKAYGINDSWELQKDGDGCGFRIGSQERALRAGLEVALGSMLGLNPDMTTEFLAVVDHARYLGSHYEASAEHPMIIGMPLWNPITTPETDRRPGSLTNFEQLFSVTASLYLLALPSSGFWVFPNCRVPMATQLEAVRLAGVFTSTEVKLGPGGYLPAIVRKAREKGEDTQALEQRIAAILHEENLSLEQLGVSLDAREQFLHDYHSHDEYCALMGRLGLEVVRGVRLPSTGVKAPAPSRSLTSAEAGRG